MIFFKRKYIILIDYKIENEKKKNIIIILTILFLLGFSDLVNTYPYFTLY